MSWSNYNEVLEQLADVGIDAGILEPGRLVRCRLVDSREKRGWYSLHELRLDDGDTVLVGSFGVWRGNDNGVQKITLNKRILTADQKQALKTRIAADRRRAVASRKAIAERAARRAATVWKKCGTQGESDYLATKGVSAHDLRYTDSNALVIPISDVLGKVQGLQFILPSDHPRRKKTGRNKEYWPPGISKQGGFHLFGGIPNPICLVAEGYATAASLFEATGYPAVVAFDAGNMRPVCENLAKRYRNIKILVCADDDYIQKCAACGEITTVETPECDHCSEPHKKANAGITSASTASMAVNGAWLAPIFSSDRKGQKLTDFNDLQQVESAAIVRSQVEARLLELKWSDNGTGSCIEQTGGEGRNGVLLPITSDDELHERFALVYGHKQTVFDEWERSLLTLGDMRDACTSREIHRRWMESPRRKIVRVREVGFDPSESDPNIKCNLYGGWPTTAKSGCCDALLELLEYLCSDEENPRDIYHWVLRWLAYPIQHPGAKMKTALILHGPQGVGKNLFFESVMAIYGEYGRIIDQNAVEDKFNDWASKKLFLIADEVVARSELYHTKNKLKSFITSDWIRINPKNVTAYDEKNHVNLVFLSNETHPLVLERDDRRYAVIWTPPKLPPDIYKEVKSEIDAGGIEALHDHLMTLDLGDFEPHTKPAITKAKLDLIDLSMDSTERFWRAWIGEEIPGVPCVPCKTQDLYALYREWCGRLGYPRYAPEPKLIAEISKRADCEKRGARYQYGQGVRQARFIFPSGQQQPPDKTQPIWLSETMELFKQGVEDWKNDGKPIEF